MVLKLAIVGRPNVGKSTLFNRLTGRRLALVDNRPGVTRDYREGRAEIGGFDVVLIDTAGLEHAAEDGLPMSVRRMTEQAVRRADVCLFLIDGRAGVTAADREIADFLRRQSKPALLAANKCEGSSFRTLAHESYSLGFGEPIEISAEHGEGISDLICAVATCRVAATAQLAEDALEAASDDCGDESLRIAVVGRPNSGKSSLINRILGSDRLLTGPVPGVTRDAISLHADWSGLKVRIHDTAGMRKRAKVTDKIEKLSVADGLRAVRFAEIVVLVLDAETSFEVQDVRIADLAEREGRAVVFAANKWDLVSDRRSRSANLLELLETRLPKMRGAALVPVSARTGYGLNRLHNAVRKSWETWNRRIPTGHLNRWLDAMKAAHPPPAPQGRRIRLRYITQVKARPPSFVIMCSRPGRLPEDYLRFLRNGLRESFRLDGVPIRIMLRSQAEDNPFV